MDKKTSSRFYRKRRIAKKVRGAPECPRLSVFRSNKHIYVQLIDDQTKTTLATASTVDKELKSRGTVSSAKQVGALVAQRALAKGVQRVVFDRNGFRYHGQVKELASGAREAGLQF